MITRHAIAWGEEFRFLYDHRVTRVPIDPNGIDWILDFLAMQYEYDTNERIVAVCGGGDLPRFVFARSAEGCIWRFPVDLPEGVVSSVAKLAGREPGLSRGWGEAPETPERLVMMARLLGVEFDPSHCGHELIEQAGALLAEVWTLR